MKMRMSDGSKATNDVDIMEVFLPHFKNLLNNSYVLEPEAPGISRYVTSFLTWLQAIMVSLGGLV